MKGYINKQNKQINENINSKQGEITQREKQRWINEWKEKVNIWKDT